MAAWREVLLEVRRKSTGCIFRLRLNIDPNDPYVGISFWEFYDYLARPGDSGREYGYGVSTPYESLEPLVTYLETRTGRTPADTEDLARRLIAAMKVMVERGDLADAMALQAKSESRRVVVRGGGRSRRAEKLGVDRQRLRSKIPVIMVLPPKKRVIMNYVS